ncbi:uncharacterized protein LOC132720656 [Ruditapes philippinarum]|uniref:uncharacterized protein LOC132720656 n=1 Tax=Ruditapes philippinarum TaxID=129788 RepID=UPI00295A6EC1|nr:uncharacterized protein LOC132720656 [Ruditapes philippinarum]
MTDKYSRLVTFVINICPKPLRELFISKAKKDKNIQYTNLKDYLVFRGQDIRTLERRNKITTDQLDHIFPASGIVDIQKWDITLSSALLKGLFKNELDTDERVCLDTITTIRNNLQHIPSTKCIEDELFDSSWNDLKNAVLLLSKYAGAPDQRSIEEEISKALTENMPNLGDVLQTWYKQFTVQLSLQNKRLEKKLNEQASEIQNVRAASEKGKAILVKGTRKRQRRSGAAVKAFNIYDQKVDNMKEKFKRGFDKPFNGSELYQDRIKLITKQLNENHRVIVTGNDNDLNYKCAFAAIKGANQCIDQCLEINNPSDWGSITFEDAKLVLFNEPFGRFKFDERKYEAMLDEIDGMLDATQGEDDDTIDIVIVANRIHLKEATDRSDHEMLCTSSVVEIDSSNINDKTVVVDDTIHRNLLDMAKTFKKSYIPKELESQAKEKAKRLFIDQSMVVIVGPTGSGKTSLSFELLPLYDLSNGEDNFVVISDPSELKFVNLSLHPLIIIKSLCGVMFNHAEAHRWYSQLDRLYAAVKENQIAVIVTKGIKSFSKNDSTHIATKINYWKIL